MNVSTATTAELVAFYNEHCVELYGKEQIKKFADRKTAERRVAVMLEDLEEAKPQQGARAAEAAVEDESLISQYGRATCPHCARHLSNGVTTFEREVESQGREKALAEWSHEFNCLGCGEGWGKEFTKNADLSDAIRRSWEVPSTKEKRLTRNAVLVDGMQFKSVRAAFVELNLPLNEHIRFRGRLKEAGAMVAYGMKWEVI